MMVGIGNPENLQIKLTAVFHLAVTTLLWLPMSEGGPKKEKEIKNVKIQVKANH